MNFKVHIDKLVGNSNWTMCKRKVVLMLRHQEVLDVVTENLLSKKKHFTKMILLHNYY